MKYSIESNVTISTKDFIEAKSKKEALKIFKEKLLNLEQVKIKTNCSLIEEVKK